MRKHTKKAEHKKAELLLDNIYRQIAPTIFEIVAHITHRLTPGCSASGA